MHAIQAYDAVSVAVDAVRGSILLGSYRRRSQQTSESVVSTSGMGDFVDQPRRLVPA